MPHCHLFFFHRFEEGRLHFCGSSIDLICKQYIVKKGPFSKDKVAFFMNINFGSDEVGWKEIGGKLNAMKIALYPFGYGFRRPRFCQPWHSLNKDVAICKKTDKNVF